MHVRGYIPPGPCHQLTFLQASGPPKPARTRAITGETPVKQHVEKIESKETPSSTGAQKVKGKVVRKPAEKARRRIPLPVLKEEVDVAEWGWEIVPQNHSTPKGEDVRKECTEEVTENGYRVTDLIHTPAGSLIGRTEEAEKQGSPKPPPGPKPGGGKGHPSYLEQQEGQDEAEEPGHQAQATEQTDAGGEKVLNWADDPWTYSPTAKDGPILSEKNSFRLPQWWWFRFHPALLRGTTKMRSPPTFLAEGSPPSICPAAAAADLC